MPLLPQSIADAVNRDGLPRQAVDETGATHVLYLEGAFVRSMLATDWPPPLPSDPTETEIAAAIAARESAERQQDVAAAALRTRVRTAAQSAVGVLSTDLNASQVRAVLMAIAWKSGALDKDGKVRPLQDWL